MALADILASPLLVLDATREALAQVIHEQYVRAELAAGAVPAGNRALAPWHEMSEDLRASNRDQAAHIPLKLRAAGCRLLPAGDDLTAFAFTEEEVERLARLEHDRWQDERRRAGWRPGPVKDVAGEVHPSLKPWEELDEADRERDRRAVRHIPSLVARAGYAIVRDGLPLHGAAPAR